MAEDFGVVVTNEGKLIAELFSGFIVMGEEVGDGRGRCGGQRGSHRKA